MKIARLLLTTSVLAIAVLFAEPPSEGSAVTCPASLSYGETIDCSISAPGETDTYTFAGTSGERVIARMVDTSGTFTPQIKIYKPDGGLLCSAHGDPAETSPENNQCSLTSDGIYTILADDYNSTGTGNYNLHLLRTANPVNATQIAYGQTASGSVDMAAEYDAYVFTGAPDDEVVIRALDTSGGSFYPKFKVYNPDGTYAGCYWYGSTLAEKDCSLNSTG